MGAAKASCKESIRVFWLTDRFQLILFLFEQSMESLMV